MDFFYFFGDGVGMSEIGGGRGVSRSGEVNPSAALSGTCFDGMRGGSISLCLGHYLGMPVCVVAVAGSLIPVGFDVPAVPGQGDWYLSKPLIMFCKT